MFALCPLVLVRKDGAIPAKLEPINPEFLQFARGHLERVETLSDVCARLGAFNPYPTSAENIVVSVREVKGVFCGGEVRYQILLAKDDMGRFERYQTYTVYLSESDGPHNPLRVAIPA